MATVRRHVPLQSLAAEQWQVLRLDQMRAAGFSANEIHILLDRGLLHHRHRGIYTYATSRPPWRGVLLAAQWSIGADAYLTGASSLALHGLTAVSLSRIEVAVPRRSVRARPRPIQLRRTQRPPERLCRRRALAYAPVERALVDLAVAGASPRRLTALITEAVHRRCLDHARMRSELAAGVRSPGLAALRRAYAGYQPAPEGHGGLERSFSAGLATRPWLPTSEANHRLETAGVCWEIDRWFGAQRVAVELHGGGYHSAGQDIEKDSVKAVKLARLDIPVFVVTETRWELEPEAVLDDLEATLSRRGWSGRVG